MKMNKAGTSTVHTNNILETQRSKYANIQLFV